MARTDTCMPTKPAAALATAPIRKPKAVPKPSVNQIRKKSTPPTTATVRYWRFRKASAPSRMASEISTARALVAGASITER